MLGPDALDALSRLSTPLHVYSFVTGTICWANPAALVIWNALSLEELRNRKIGPLSRAVQLRLAAYREAFGRGETRQEFWTIYPKGEATSCLSFCRGVSLPGHDHAMLVETKVSSETLTAAEVRSLEALRHTPLMITLYTRDGEVLMRNPAAAAVLGARDCSAKSENLFLAMFADRKQGEALLATALREERAMDTVSIAIPGQPVHHMQITAIGDPATGEQTLLVSQQDMTEIAEVRRKLAASEEVLEQILELNASPMMQVSATDGSVSRANQAAEQMLGLPDSWKAGTFNPFASLGAVERAQSMADRPESVGGYFQLRRVNGSRFWAYVWGKAIRVNDDDTLALFIHDLDDLYRSTSELRTALETEKRTSETQRRLLAVASHEFRTPLAIIDSAVQRLDRAIEAQSSEQLQSGTERVRFAVRHLTGLLESTIARVGQGQIPGYNPVPGNIAELVETVAQSMREMFSDIRITVDLDALPQMMIDPNLIQRAVLNLLTNSVKYTVGAAQIDITCSIEDGRIALLVSDRGIGIPDADKSRVLNSFSRGSNVDKHEGVGLGLYIVASIMTRHAGSLRIMDREGGGTTIALDFPRDAIIAPSTERGS